MKNQLSKSTMKEIEKLRMELYYAVNNRRELLSSQEVYEVSKRLDKLIVQQMYLANKKKQDYSEI